MLQDLDEQLVDRSECYKIEFERATRELEKLKKIIPRGGRKRGSCSQGC